MITNIDSDTIWRFQQGLINAGLLRPEDATGTWNPALIPLVESYWTSLGWTLPTNALEAQHLFQKSFKTDPADMQSGQEPELSLKQEQLLGSAYAEAKGWHLSFLQKHAKWLVPTLAGLALLGGGYAAYKIFFSGRPHGTAGLLGWPSWE